MKRSGLFLRLSEKQVNQIRDSAKKSGMKLNEFVLQQTFSSNAKTPFLTSLIKQTIALRMLLIDLKASQNQKVLDEAISTSEKIYTLLMDELVRRGNA